MKLAEYQKAMGKYLWETHFINSAPLSDRHYQLLSLFFIRTVTQKKLPPKDHQKIAPLFPALAKAMLTGTNLQDKIQVTKAIQHVHSEAQQVPGNHEDFLRVQEQREASKKGMRTVSTSPEHAVEDLNTYADEQLTALLSLYQPGSEKNFNNILTAHYSLNKEQNGHILSALDVITQKQNPIDRFTQYHQLFTRVKEEIHQLLKENETANQPQKSVQYQRCTTPRCRNVAQKSSPRLSQLACHMLPLIIAFLAIILTKINVSEIPTLDMPSPR